MAQAPRKLGILLSVAPPHPNFHHALQLATAGLNARDEVYIYCLDDAVHGLADERFPFCNVLAVFLSRVRVFLPE